MKAEFLSAILLVSEDPKRLYNFYRDKLGVPLTEEQHDDEPLHYGCELGDIHFAIHRTEAGQNVGSGCVKLALEVFDMDGYVKQLEENDVPLLYPPKKMGPMLLTAVRDPDGNTVEFTQLGKAWIEHLKKRRSEGHDLIQRYES